MNKDIKYALEYHEETKHSELSIRSSNHYLDWDNRPSPFKFYSNIPPVDLPINFPSPSLNVITMKDSSYEFPPINTEINTKLLSSLLFYSSGITRQIKLAHGRYFMRAAPATGALYPIEVYIVSGNINGLRAGVYHFCPGLFNLTKLRDGDYRLLLSRAAGKDEKIKDSPFTIILTSIAWRNAWKYQARSYRHWFWDSGVIASNLIATAMSFGLDTKLIIGFVDKIVNELLCLDEKEAAIVLATVGNGLTKEEPGEVDPPRKLVPETIPISHYNEVEYPQIWKLHNASSLNSSDDVRIWKESVIIMQEIKESEKAVTNLHSKPIAPKPTISQSLSDVILLRGSTRKFSRKPITFVQLSNVLSSLTKYIHSDFAGNKSIIDIYFIANDVTNLNRGAYFFNQEDNSIDILKANVHRNTSGYLCLEQPLFSDAAVVFYMLTNLKTILDRLGNRGYRACQFESGVLAGRIYLSAYSQAMGASGSTFYDDAVTEFFSPHAKDKDVMITVGIGIPDYNSKSGKILAGKFTRNDLLS